MNEIRTRLRTPPRGEQRSPAAQALFRQALRVELKTHDGRIACERCLVAEAALTRMRGLLGRSGLAAGEGLLLRPASSIHTFFMRFPIDAVFLGRSGEVLKVAQNLAPWRAARCSGARSVLELPAGESARRGLEPGVRLATGF